MPLFRQILLCLAVALPLSALYYGSHQADKISFYFEPVTATAFFATALLAVVLHSAFSGRTAQPGENNQSPKKSGRSSKRSRPKKNGRETGTVKWFNGSKGFGFITRSNGEDVFVHFRSLQKDSRRLAPGQSVEFIVTDGSKGPEASEVCVL